MGGSVPRFDSSSRRTGASGRGVEVLESVHADRPHRPPVDTDPSPPVRGDRARGRPDGPWSGGGRAGHHPVHHRGLDVPGAQGLGVGACRGDAHRHGRARAPPRGPRLRSRLRIRRRARPHRDGALLRGALPRPARRHHHPRPVQRRAHRPLSGARAPRAHHRHLPCPTPGCARHPDRPGDPSRARRVGVPLRRRLGGRGRRVLPVPGADGARQGRASRHRGRPQSRPPGPAGGQDARTVGALLLRRAGCSLARIRCGVPR